MRGVVVVLSGFALIAVLLAWSRWLAGRRFASAGHGVLAIATGWVALVLWTVAGSLESYQPAVRGQPVAELFLEQTGSRSYRGTLTRLPVGRVQVFELEGDQWRLEARTLDWRGWAAGIGLAPMYRLELLGTRVVRSSGEGTPAPLGSVSRFALAEDTGDDLWAKARTQPRWMRHLEGGHADGPWRPLADEARYTVWLVDGTLRVEAANEAAAGTAPAG